jgi:hypothetical protein
MVMRDEREISIVRRQLGRLGMTIASVIPPSAAADEAVDVIVLDADSIPIKSDHGHRCGKQRADHRADRNRDAEPLEVAARPAAGIVPGQAAALGRTLHRAGGRVRFGATKDEEANYLEKLEDRIRSRRVVFAAVLQIMRGHGLSETDAFALIRQTAMRHRTTIEQLSAEIIAVGGMPNRTTRSA